MRHTLRYTVLLLGVGMTLAIGWPAGVQGLTQQAVGLYMAVVGKVTVVHVGQPAAMPVKLQESVYFKDVIETQADSRAKALFDDDSILTVGENSRVEVSEYIYDSANDQRSSVLRLVQGKARALVGKLFAGLGSRFEVHTPTAVAAARGTYFVVWIEEKASQKIGMSETGTVRPVSLQGLEVAELQAGGTGVANIGNSGNVAFTSGGQTVVVPPGNYAFAPPGMPPFAPVIITPSVPSGVTGAIASTEVPDVPQPESPGQVATAVGGVPPPPAGGTGPILQSPTLPPVPGGVTPPSVLSGAGALAVSPSAPGAPTVLGSIIVGVGGGGGNINDPPRQAECPSCAQ